MPPSRSFSVLPVLLGFAFAAPAHAADHYVATTGSDSAAGTLAAPYKTIAKGIGVSNAGDTVWVRGGTYSGAVFFSKSGAAGSYLTVSAYPGELPIIDGGGSASSGISSSSATYVKFVGLAVRNFGSSAFSNGWVNDTGTSNGNWQIVACIAEGNGINGIAFYNASGILIDESIVAHNGNTLPSWSSGVNLFHVSGGATSNIVRRTVSFENVDISSNHTDGSGFILDQNSDGATFENNLGFRNGGSCVRITNSTGVHLVNNTCFHDGLDANDVSPNNPGEIYAWPPLASGSAVLVNNLLAASGWNNTMTALSNVAGGSNNVTVNSNGATPFFVNPAGLDFHLVAGSAAEIDAGTSSNAPTTDLGFDPKCIKAQSGALSFWQFAPDYTYIASVGGIAGCFNPNARPLGSAPDIGAYEFKTTASGCASASDCNDGNACTTDSCNTQTGTCGHAALSGCCTSASDCNDGDACTTDACTANACVHTSVTGCCDRDADCSGASTCVTVSCNVASHACVSATVPGCCTKNADCNDGDACTTDACDTSTGVCTNALVAACCSVDGDCTDGDACTLDTCNRSTNRCAHTADPACAGGMGGMSGAGAGGSAGAAGAHAAGGVSGRGGAAGAPSAGGGAGRNGSAAGGISGSAAGGVSGNGGAGGVGGATLPGSGGLSAAGAGTAGLATAGAGAIAGAPASNGGMPSLSGGAPSNIPLGGAGLASAGGGGSGNTLGSAGASSASGGSGVVALAGSSAAELPPTVPDPPGAFDCACSTPRGGRSPFGYACALVGLALLGASRRRARLTPRRARRF